MSEANSNAASTRSWIALGLTFLLLGIGFATPLPLVRAFPVGIWEGQISREALNLYALTAFLGWAHFVYAWQGQVRSVRRMRRKQSWLYWLMILATLAVLVVSRHLLGVGVFSLAIWVYNIGHFIKAEAFFAANRRKTAYRAPAVAFAWFTLCLFRAGPLGKPSLVFAVTLALALAYLLREGWRTLTSGESRMPIFTLFLLGETLVWSAYGPYMTPAFRVGVYVFHIAAASFYHYISSYVFAAQRGKPTISLTLVGIIGVNVAFVLFGCAVNWLGFLAPLRLVLSPEWFTLWVALHLAASDLLPWWRLRLDRGPRSPAADSITTAPPQTAD